MVKSFVFKVVILLPVFLILSLAFSSCGFYGLNTGSVFQTGSITGSDTRRSANLSNRRDRTSTNSRDDDICEDNDACEEVCREIFEDSDSQDSCHRKTIEEVGNMQDLFDILVKASGGDDDLEDVDTDDLEMYLSVGVDGWADSVMEQIERQDKEERYNRLLNMLVWIVDNRDVAIQLEREDRDHKVLSQIFLDLYEVKVQENINRASCPGRFVINVTTVNGEDTIISVTINGEDTIVEINGTREKELFLALWFSYGGDWNFFIESSAPSQRYKAFELGHNLLAEVCRDSSSRDEAIKNCIQSFYCCLNKKDYPTSNNENSTNEKIRTALREPEIRESDVGEIDISNSFCDK